ncbi:hypothetical protein L7F22_006397 [Adiantum nelumboides]|nr:hypothetical protein [Adiantum nelumboides]
MRQTIPMPMSNAGCFGGGSVFQAMIRPSLALDGFMPDNAYGAMQAGSSNPMLGKIGVQPGFKCAAGSYGMPGANMGMAGFSQPDAQNLNMAGRAGGNFGSRMPLLNAPPKGKPKDYKGDKQSSLTPSIRVFKDTKDCHFSQNQCASMVDYIVESSHCDARVIGNSAQLIARSFGQVPYIPEGLEAVVFTADGDMRQALNNLQATFSGFHFVNQENVFKVCDQPHPLHVINIIQHTTGGNIDEAHSGLKQLYDLGYSASDIITTVFRVVKNYDMPEYLKLEYLKEVGFAHMRIADGVGTILQLSGLLAKLCIIRDKAKAV